jgi:hypothetical protein
MSKKSSKNSKTTSTETLGHEATTEELIEELRRAYPPLTKAPEWYVTTTEFIALLDSVCEMLPWMDDWNRRRGHPEDIATSVSMTVDTMSATISAMAARGMLKYRGQE